MVKLTSLLLSLVALTASSYVATAFTTSTTSSRSVSSTYARKTFTKAESAFAMPRNPQMTTFMSSADEGEAKKETTWDRITGPKLFKTVTNWNGIHSVPLVPLRIFTGLLMIHHGSEGGFGPANFGTPEFQGFMDYIMKPYFGFLPGSLEFWAALHDYAEFFGGICFTIGFLTRPAALSLLITMSSAVYFHLSSTGLQGFPFGHVSNYSYDFEEPLLYALIFLMFWFNGAGPLSVDSVIYSQISQEEEE